MKWSKESEKDLIEAFRETKEMRFEREGQRWGAVTYAFFNKTGKMVSARAARTRITKIKEREEIRERYSRQGILPDITSDPSPRDDAKALSQQLGALYSEVLALREDMRAVSRKLAEFTEEIHNV